MTQTQEKRRHRRLAVSLPLTITTATGKIDLTTEDVSFSGLFVRTDDPAPLRRLVKLHLTMPDTKEQMEMLAMVVYTVSAEQSKRFSKPPGMGLNLYGLNAQSRLKWREFVARTIDLHDQARLQDLTTLPGRIEPIRRRFPRFEAEFVVHVETTQALYDMVTLNISAGGAFLATDEVLAAGTDIKLTIVHPEDGSEFVIKGQVVRHIPAKDGAGGLGVCFEEMDSSARSGFVDFIESGLPVVDIESDLILDGDDDLLE